MMRRRFLVAGIVSTILVMPSAMSAENAPDQLGMKLPIQTRIAPSQAVSPQVPSSQTTPRKAPGVKADRGAVAFSLPMSGALSKGSGPNSEKTLEVTISINDSHSPISGRVDGLMESAISRDPEIAKLNADCAHYAKPTQRLIAHGKDALNITVPFRGFGPSIEASNLILSEDFKVKSRSAADFAKQKHVDDIHSKVVSSMMQIAMGMGMNDTKRGHEVVTSGMATLTDLVGETQANETLAMLSRWKQELIIPEEFYIKEAWDVKTKQGKLEQILSKAISTDNVVTGITTALHKYNKKSKFSRVSSQVIQSALGIAAATPTFAAPAARFTLTSYIMATGGPEQSKLLKQLYLDKRLDSRWKLLNEESHLAIDNYQLGMLTKNALLVAMSEALVQEMTDQNTSKEILGQSVWSPDSKMAQSCGRSM